MADKITFGIALIGAGLGILNTWRSFYQDRIRLKIIPQWTLFQDGRHTLCIEVINIGYVAVTVSQVGFRLRDRKQVFIFIPMPRPGSELPKRLEPRASFTVLAPFGTDEHESMRGVNAAFAKTACLRIFTGNSDALRGVVTKSRAAGKDRKQKST
jgi:hypothetical protein